MTRRVGPAFLPKLEAIILCLGIVLLSNTSMDLCGQTGQPTDAEINSYIRQLNDDDRRAEASHKLVEIGPKAIPALSQSFRNIKSHSVAFKVLHEIAQQYGSGAIEAVPTLIEALKDDQISIRPDAAAALGEIGIAARSAIPALTEALQDKEHADVRNAAIRALATIAGKLQDEGENLSDRDLNQAVIDLEAGLEAAQATAPPEYVLQIRRPLEFLRLKLAERNKGLFPWIKKTYADHPWIILPPLYPLLLIVWFVFSLLAPHWLFRFNEWLKAWPRIKVPSVDIRLSVPTLLLLSPFHYCSRVLDAWVADHVESARKWLSANAEEHHQETHIPTHLKMNLTNYHHGLKAAELGQEFPVVSGRLLIWGEGGIGKTNLAYEVARWAMAQDRSQRLAKHLMLPVLLEEVLGSQLQSQDASQTKGELFMAAICSKLKQLIRAQDAPDPELVKHLLRKRRLMVIVDSSSGISEDVTKALNLRDSEFPANALVITSRNEERQLLRGEIPVRIEPQLLAGTFLTSFLEELLAANGQRQIAQDEDFHDLCGTLRKIAGKRVPALMAKLYVEYIIAFKKGVVANEAPKNIPELMIIYLNSINRRPDPVEPHSDEEVHRDTKVIAWECLKNSYRPEPATREFVLNAMGGQEAMARLHHLEKKLRLVQEYDYKTEHKLIKFSFDRLAEYLAGLHLIDLFGSDKSLWWNFLAGAKNKPGIESFMQAVAECVRAKGEMAGVPPFVLEVLEKGPPWDLDGLDLN